MKFSFFYRSNLNSTPKIPSLVDLVSQFKSAQLSGKSESFTMLQNMCEWLYWLHTVKSQTFGEGIFSVEEKESLGFACVVLSKLKRDEFQRAQRENGRVLAHQVANLGEVTVHNVEKIAVDLLGSEKKHKLEESIESCRKFAEDDYYLKTAEALFKEDRAKLKEVIQFVKFDHVKEVQDYLDQILSDQQDPDQPNCPLRR